MGAPQTDMTTWTNQLTTVESLHTSGNPASYPMQDANAVELGVFDVDPQTGQSDLQNLHGYAPCSQCLRSVLGFQVKTMRGAGGNKERWGKASCAYPRS